MGKVMFLKKQCLIHNDKVTFHS